MDNKKNSFTVKDCINIGVFAALYIVIFFVTSFIGYIPIMMAILGVACAVTCGIPLMLFFSKSHVFGMVSIMGAIMGIFMILMGRPWYCILVALAAGVAADFVLKSGNYKSINKAVIGSGVFSLWMMGMEVPLYFGARDTFIESIKEGYGEAYAEVIVKITPDWMFYATIVLTFVGGILGGLLGKAVLKKHFKKAGMA
ncbi:MAG: MptD family putative ECF transporter S component [Lachnospiraceae bacterium]|nr:MptD family putative ECF transporter S component [Lachnospiraceae bacterium]